MKTNISLFFFLCAFVSFVAGTCFALNSSKYGSKTPKCLADIEDETGCDDEGCDDDDTKEQLRPEFPTHKSLCKKGDAVLFSSDIAFLQDHFPNIFSPPPES